MNIEFVQEKQVSEILNGRFGIRERQGCNANPTVVSPVDPMDAGQSRFFGSQPGMMGVQEKKALTSIDVGIDANDLGKSTPAPATGRQAYFHEYLKRISWHLGTRSLPVFLDFNGERRRMDKGCIGHAVAAGILKPPINGSDGITHVELAEGET